MMKTYLMWWKCIWADLAYAMLSEENKKYVKADVEVHRLKYIRRECGFFYAFNFALLNVKPFRSIFEYRVRTESGLLKKILVIISGIFLPRIPSVEITGGIFGGAAYST